MVSLCTGRQAVPYASKPKTTLHVQLHFIPLDGHVQACRRPPATQLCVRFTSPASVTKCDQSQRASATCFVAGGKEADKQARAAIKMALTPAARATPNRNKPYALNHCDRYGSNSRLPYTQALYDPTIGQHIYQCAVWSRADVNMEYDMKIMAEPAVHESAAKEILEGDLHFIRSAPPAFGGCSRYHASSLQC